MNIRMGDYCDVSFVKVVCWSVVRLSGIENILFVAHLHNLQWPKILTVIELSITP